MLPIQFFGQNIHFVINLFAALVFFATFWLYFDAWTAKRDFKELIKWLGFLLLAMSYLVESTMIEQSVLGSSLSIGKVSEMLAAILGLLGLTAIILGQLVDPLQKKPELAGLEKEAFVKKKSNKKTLPAIAVTSITNPLHWLPPVGVMIIAVLYWRRATTGLERHLKPMAIAFGLLFISKLLALASLWRGTDNPTISKLVVAFGPLWIAELVFLLAGMLVLGHWVWKYLTRRFMSQLFMIFTSMTLVIFVLTTVSFSYLLVNNVQKAALNNLGTAASVLNYALSSKQAETLANTQTIAENMSIINAVASKDHKSLVSLTANFLHDKQQSSLVITSNAGQVLLRAENPDRYGDSLSSNSLIRRALIGQSSSGVSTQDGVLAPLIYIRSATPIRDSSNQIIGSAVGSLVIDNAFVDGIKQATGLDSSIYAGNVRSATTFVAPDGLSRWIGVKETNSVVQSTVLKKDQTFKGALSIQNRQYLVVYAPLKDINNNVIGMLFVGKPQMEILKAAGRSVELTFVVSAILLLSSIIPAYLISKYLARQLD